jgi:hypothetical protein
MERDRLREFRQVRSGRVKPQWTARDLAEYEEWLGHPAVNPSRDIEARRRQYFDLDWREVVVIVCLIAALVAILIPVLKRIQEAARHAEELNGQKTAQLDQTP